MKMDMLENVKIGDADTRRMRFSCIHRGPRY